MGEKGAYLTVNKMMVLLWSPCNRCCNMTVSVRSAVPHISAGHAIHCLRRHEIHSFTPHGLASTYSSGWSLNLGYMSTHHRRVRTLVHRESMEIREDLCKDEAYGRSLIMVRVALMEVLWMLNTWTRSYWARNLQKMHGIFRASLSCYTFVRGPHFGHRTRVSLNIALITVMWCICVYQSVLWLNVGLSDMVSLSARIRHHTWEVQRIYFKVQNSFKKFMKL